MPHFIVEEPFLISSNGQNGLLVLMQIWFVLSVFGGDCYMNIFANYQGLIKGNEE